MIVTALIEDELIEQVKRATGGKNITDSFTIALKSYLSNQKINKIIEDIEAEPLAFREDFTAFSVRQNNRNR